MLECVGFDLSRPFVPAFTVTPVFRTTRAPGPSVALSRTLLLKRSAVIDFRTPEIITVIDRPARVEIASLLPSNNWF